MKCFFCFPIVLIAALLSVAGITSSCSAEERIFHGAFTWTQQVLVLPTAKPGKYELPVNIKLQVCNEDGCFAGNYPPLTFPVEIVGDPIKPSDSISKEVEDAKVRLSTMDLKPVDVNNPSTKVLKKIINLRLVVGGLDPFGPEYRSEASPILKVQPGQVLLVTIAGTPEPGYHTYSMTDKEKIGTIAIRIGDGATFLGFGPISESPEPEIKREARADFATADDANPSERGLIPFLFAAFVGAFLMLLTPCVFPMIPITVNYFLKQSEKEHHRPMGVALTYSGTIVVVLSLAMLLLGKVIIDMANNAWFNLFLGAVMVFFALSLFGMYEIELPSAFARFTSAREGQGGYLGAMFMALTFTITSFTCTGPFLGIMLGTIGGVRPPVLHLILGSIVYSITFAAPFFFLALFPGLLKKLPKSGSWMNTVKVTMGFLELAFALKFFANTDLAWSPGNGRFFNFDTVLVAWIVLSVSLSLYLFGMFRLPHDEPVEHVGVVRMLVGSLVLGLGLYMTPALFGGKLKGVVGENILAFLPPSLNHKDWHLDYLEAWTEAKKDKKLIFIDFTGVNCTNCRGNEENVFPKPEVENALKKYVRVQLYTDTVPNPELSASEAGLQADRNSAWRDALADPSNPNYVIFQPDYDQPFDGDMIKGRVLGRRKGTIRDRRDFVTFLRSPFQPASPKALVALK
jgi:cytochrome c biogenesis protein CcdA